MLRQNIRRPIAHKVDNPFLHGNRYGVAFLENDLAEMQRQVAAAAGKPGEDVLLSFASDTEAFYGRLANARRLSQRAIDSAHGNDSKETAAAWRMNAALREAEFNNTVRARQEIVAATGGSPQSRCKRPRSAGLRAHRRYRPGKPHGTRFSRAVSAQYRDKSLLVASHLCFDRN